MSELYATLELRPTRIGLLVDQSNRDHLLDASRLTNCVWGGLANPIIPSAEQIPDAWKSFAAPDPTSLAKGYSRFFEPDVYVEVSPNAAKSAGIAATPIEFGATNIITEADQQRDVDNSQRDTSFGLEAEHLYAYLYEKEFKFQAREGHKVAYYKTGHPDDLAFTTIVSGGFPSTGKHAAAESMFSSACGAEAWEATPENWLRGRREGYLFPLAVGMHGVERTFEGGGLSDPIVYVINPASAGDLIDFWNLRLVERKIVPVNLRWLESLAPALRKFIRANYQKIPGNPFGTMTRPVIQFGRSFSAADVAAVLRVICDASIPTDSFSYKTWYDRLWERPVGTGFVFQPRRAKFLSRRISLQLSVQQSSKRNFVRFESLQPEFAPKYASKKYSWVNVLNAKTYDLKASYALSFPEDYSFAGLRFLRVSGHISASREGLVLDQSGLARNEYLELLHPRRAFKEWASQAGLTASTSEAGKIAEQVIAHLNKSVGSGLLAHEATLHLLDRMAKSSRKTSAGVTETFPDRTVPASVWAALIAKRAAEPLGPRVSIETLVRSGVLRLGLAVQCDHCDYKNWYSIKDLATPLICERCRDEFEFPEGKIDLKTTPWYFRVVGPFATPNYGEGSYGVALALRVFSDLLGSSLEKPAYSLGLALKTPDNEELEVDLALWYRKNSSLNGDAETVPVLCEAKSFGKNCFKQTDVQKMRRVSEHFPAAFIAFATLKNTLDPEEIQAIREFAEWGQEPLADGRPRAPVIVLTGRELLANWSIEKAWDSAGGEMASLSAAVRVRLDDLHMLSRLTQKFYLGLSSYDERRHMLRGTQSDQAT